MKCYKSLMITLLACLSISSYAQSSSELFQRANDMRVSGNISQAVELYQRVKFLDPSYEDDCNYWINHLKSIKVLELSSDRIDIPYQGGVYEVSVFNVQDWFASCSESWISIERKGKILSLSCVSSNDRTEPRTAVVEVRSGSYVKRIIVHNDAAPEYLFPSSSILNFQAKGASESIEVRTNAFWTITSHPSWCTIERDENRLNVSAEKNNLSEPRRGDIKLTSSSGQQVSVYIVQNAGMEAMGFSKNQIRFSETGGTDTVKVHTEAEDWFVADYPQWCRSMRVNDTTLVISCAQNEPTGFTREGGINISTGHRTLSIEVSQQLRPKPEYVPIKNIMGGRDISFGLSAGYLMPFISAKSSSDYICSAVNYGLGDSREQVSYLSNGGFTVGVFADVRLFRNLYMMIGANYTFYSYANTFDEIYDRRINVGGKSLYGTTDNHYEEKYKLSFIDVPVLLSYRFPLTYMNHIRVNAGPILSIGLSGRMDIDGLTVAPYMHEEGTAWYTPWDYSCSGKLGLFTPYARYSELHTGEGVSERPIDYSLDMSITDAPFSRFNAGASVGIAYEIRGLAIGVDYYAMLNNIANGGYWESERMEIFQYKSGILMSGYTQRNHRIQLSLSYTFRYKKK